MKTLFFGDGNFKNKFIHLVNTHGEISLFLDKNSLDRFNHNLSSSIKEIINSDSSCFRAIEIYSLENDLHSSGVTSLISGNLAEVNIPLVYTNSFNSSFILVPENRYLEACVILKSLADESEDKSDD